MANNPPAFARPHSTGIDEYCSDQTGMSLLDYFAGQALSIRSVFEHLDGSEEFAKAAYDIAEAMLVEREKRMR